MRKLKKYYVYIDIGDDVVKIIVPSTSRTAAIEFCKGNGKIIKVVEATDINIDYYKLLDTLKNGGYKEEEIYLILRTLEVTGIIE